MNDKILLVFLGLYYFYLNYDKAQNEKPTIYQFQT
jgi:hypothetical protein